MPPGKELKDQDHDLLCDAAQGCRASFERVVDRHGDAVLRYIRLCTPGADGAEDVFQETFVAAWKRAASFRGGSNARGWLIAIARNLVHRRFRQAQAEPHHTQSLDTTSLETLGVAAGWGEDDGLQKIETQDLIHTGLSRLTGDEREIIVLRDLEGYGNDETAAILNLSVAAVKSRIHRARLHLMANIRKEL